MQCHLTPYENGYHKKTKDDKRCQDVEETAHSHTVGTANWYTHGNCIKIT
jgi:hypothetical protein